MDAVFNIVDRGWFVCGGIVSVADVAVSRSELVWTARITTDVHKECKTLFLTNARA